MRPDASAIAAQVRALAEAPTPRDHGDVAWERAVIGEMEHVLVSGYACALQLDGERRRLEEAVRDLALRVDAEIESVSALRRTRRELGARSGELDGLRTLLSELRGRIDDRRRGLTAEKNLQKR